MSYQTRCSGYLLLDTIKIYIWQNSNYLAPICRNVPDDPALQTAIPPRPYEVSTGKLDDVQPVRSDRELFPLKSVYVSPINVFESVIHEKSREKQTAEYAPYIQYIYEVYSG